MNTQHAQEIINGERFAFGANWRRFLETVDEERIAEARASLQGMLDMETLGGKSFLDIGSGSGLFSLAARQLGATVTSFDYDPDSVACTKELRRRFRDGDTGWNITQGSVLDAAFLESLGRFDVVYSWGVMHHTGAMWQAIEKASRTVATGGRLFISIYNDQGTLSRWWAAVKRVYCSGILGRWLVLGVFVSCFTIGCLVMDAGRGVSPFKRYANYKKRRGMSLIHDWVDWLGGYPFEVAKPEAVFDCMRDLGFNLERLTTCGGKLGCNEYVFVRTALGGQKTRVSDSLA